MTEIVENRLNCLVGRVRKVRRWLVALAILKVAALCLIFVSAYVGIYAWIDHRLHFDTTGRIIALGLLVAGIVLLLSRLTRALLGHVSCSRAANYIEGKRSFEQQLVTAIEYHEKKRDYPYSEALAEHLVLQVDKDSEDFDFDSTVKKWLGYIFAAVIVFGLIVAGSYIHQTGRYFYSYFARLTRPLAAVEPMPATTLEAITEDIVAEPNASVTLAAAIKGRVPESGHFVLAAADANMTDTVSDEPARQTSQIEPAYDEQDKPVFEVTRSFAEPAHLRYRFEAGPAASDWHNINISTIPKIKSITAKVTLGDDRYIKPYEQQLKDYTLEVAKDSFVTLSVETTEPLSQATIKGLSGKTETKSLNNTNKFDHRFVASRKGFVELGLASAEGVKNQEIPPLQILMKPDKAPEFKLVSPEGDYLATNVASVPITFEITDDYGLDSAKLYLEMPDGQAEEMPIPVQSGRKTTQFSHTLELEEHDLALGDSILFYAGASDLDTGADPAKGPSSSDMYFIEVRPYRQLWHQPKPGMPGGSGKQGLRPDSGEQQMLESLLSILEYTRAIIKKTWTIANKPQLADLDRSRLDSINKDVKYCAEQVAIIRDFFYNSDAEGKAKLNEVIDYYAQTDQLLAQHDASGALVPEKQAYRILRKLVLELEKALMLGGGGSTPQRRDHVKMEERVHMTRYEKERIEWELKQLAQKLEELAAEQKRLKKEFENFLKQQEKKKLAQETTDQESWTSNEKPGKPCPACGSSDPNSCPACSPQTSVDGALPPPSPSQAQAQASGSGQGQSGTTGSTANSQQQMEMLQAKQRALQEKVALLKESVQNLEKMSDADKAQGQQEAQEHMDKAMAEMTQFRSKLADAQYGAGKDDSALAQAAEKLEQAERQLDQAIEALENQFPLTEQEKLAKQTQELAEEMAEIADALDEPVQGPDRELMLARLEEAKRMLQMIMDGQLQGAQAAEGQEGQQGQGTQDNTGDAVQTAGSTFAVAWGNAGLPSNVRLAPAHAARFMARQFWSIAI
ncbi:MAG: hypothetical protein ACYTEX_25805, partial [Planctomycetota bacterium]